MNKTLAILFLGLFLLQPFQVVARDNPFVSKTAPKKEVKLPTVASKVFARIMIWQHRLNTKLTEQVKQLKTDRSWATLFPLILVSFLYGVIHAAGPGHGKVVVFSYFMSRRSRIKKGLLLGNLISLAGLLSILGQEGLLKGFSGKGRARYWIQTGFTILGALLMIGFGAVLLIGIL